MRRVWIQMYFPAARYLFHRTPQLGRCCRDATRRCSQALGLQIRCRRMLRAVPNRECSDVRLNTGAAQTSVGWRLQMSEISDTRSLRCLISRCRRFQGWGCNCSWQLVLCCPVRQGSSIPALHVGTEELICHSCGESQGWDRGVLDLFHPSRVPFITQHCWKWCFSAPWLTQFYCSCQRRHGVET